MREILFRAKRIDNGEWAYGFYSQLPKPSLGATIITNGELCAEDVSDYIIVNECKQHSNFSNAYPLEVVECEYYEINQKTLCQYTGLKDMNGNRIWENDIVKIENSMDEGVGNIEFYGGAWYVDGEPNNSLYDIVEYDDVAEVEVIGNIFDNQELMKGE